MAVSPIPKPKGQERQARAEVQPRQPRGRAVLSETTARTTIGMMRSIASHKPITPFHLMAADQMERLLNEVLEYRKKK
jgi:Mrp family chromosome partitioning ATPase